MRVHVLGSFGVEVGGARVGARRWRLRKARTLVAMLALAPGQRMHREQVIERLWREVDVRSGAHNLHQALYVARRALGEAEGHALLTIEQEEVVLCSHCRVAVDALEFEAAARDALATDESHLLRAALDLYVDDLLTDHAYADWITERRADVRATAHAVGIRLAEQLTSTGRLDEARPLLEGVLARDPVHEGAVRAAMRALAAAGRRSEALARYERLKDDLLEAFGTDPDAQTTELFARLLTGSAPSVAPVVRGNRPTPLTSFVARERELQEITGLMTRCRLTTLTGAGGCGKTRLAVEAAGAVGDRHPHGVWFVDLAVLSEPRLLPNVVATALGLTPGSGADATRALVDQLRGRTALVVLDNCEHLLDAATRLVGAVLGSCPEVTVLVTSREPLRVPGEVTFRVPSLEVPRVSRTPLQPVDLADVPSVELFVERARRARPDFRLTSENATPVAAICRRLDGIPLALELAAARVSMLEPADIETRLENVLTILGGEPFGLTRHETLHAALAWSHDLLGPLEQAMLRRMSVFAGGFGVAAVEAVCATSPLDTTNVIEVLGRLVDKSLVQIEPSTSGMRYRLLETVRQFAWEQLSAEGRADESRRAHCTYYSALAEAHDPELVTGQAPENPLLLDREHDNFRAALRWALTDKPADALVLVASLWRFWLLRGHTSEGSDWVERALVAAPEPSLARARALVGLTCLDSRRGRSDRLRAKAAEAVSIAARVGDEPTAVLFRLVHAMLVWCTLEVTEAEHMALDVGARARDLDRRDLLAGSIWVRAMCALTREEGRVATGLLQECLDQLAETNRVHPPFLPVVTPCVTLVPVAGRLVPSFEESLIVGRRVGVDHAIAYALAAQGYASRLADDLGRARAAVAEALVHFTHLGDDLGRAQALNQLGCVLRDLADFREAEPLLREAWAIRRRVGDWRGEWLARGNLALMLALQGSVDEGRSDARACLTAFEAVEDRPAAALAYGTLANIELACGELRAARGLYARAAEEFTTQSFPRSEAWHRLMAAELAAEMGDDETARREVTRGAVLFSRQRCAVAEGRVKDLQAVLGDR